MMSRVKILTKLFFKSIYEDAFNLKNRDAFSTLGVIILGIFLIGCISSPILIGVASSYGVLALYGNQNVLLEFIMSLINILILIMGMVMILNVFFFSKDIEIILPLPVKPGEIIISKFLSCLAYSYSAMLIIIPPLIMFGILDGKGIIYYINLIFIVLLAPILPLSLSAIISLVLMRVSNFSKKKDLLKIIMGIVGMALALGIQLMTPMLNRIGQGDTSGIENKVVNVFNNILLSSRTSILALSSNGIESALYVLLTAVVALIVLGIFYFIGNKIYFKSAMGSKESSSKRIELNDQILNKYIGKKPIILDFIINDFKILLRTPAYFLNTILIIIIVPVIFGVMFWQMSAMGEGGVSELQELINIVPSSNIILVVLGIGAFLSASNPTAASSFSREGQEFYYRKYLPVSYRTQVMAKYILALGLNVIAYLVILIMALFLFKIDIYIIIIGSILSVATISIISSLGVIIDMKDPKLIWDNEQMAVKNNMNVAKAMFSGLAIIIIVSLVGIISSGSMLIMCVIEVILLTIGNYITISTMLKDAGESMELA